MYFDMSYINLSKIDILPYGINVLKMNGNNISKIENLPKYLKYFYCIGNNITKIENLPNNLQSFYCDFEKITHVDNIHFDHFIFKNEFNLHWYNTFKKIQRRIRIRHIKKVNAIKLIQRNCENWLWKPVCKDGTEGINARISWKKIKNE